MESFRSTVCLALPLHVQTSGIIDDSNTVISGAAPSDSMVIPPPLPGFLTHLMRLSFTGLADGFVPVFPSCSSSAGSVTSSFDFSSTAGAESSQPVCATPDTLAAPIVELQLQPDPMVRK